MFILDAVKNHLSVGKKESVTSGSVNAYTVCFRFSADWNGLSRIAVFQAGCKEVSVLLDSSGECTIPWEVLTEPGRYLMVGVCGKRGERLVLPTIWANLGMVKEGAISGGRVVPPTPELWEQALDRKGDRLDYTEDGELGLFSGEKRLSSLPVSRGIDDHRRLTNRDADDQHPIEAISGLAKELERIPAPVEALTNSELEEILK